MMSKKIKGFALDSKASVEDVKKARLKHQSLMQDYEELQKEVSVMRSRLETAKEKKLMLAAEVRFLQRKRRCFNGTNTAQSGRGQPHARASTSLRQTKSTKKRPIATIEAAAKHSLPSNFAANPKKRRKVIQQVTPHVTSSPAINRARKRAFDGTKEPSRHSFTQIPMSDLNHREFSRNTLDLNQKQRTSAATMRNPAVSFDLNQDGAHGVREQPSSLKAPIFDLNEVSTGEEELYGNVDTSNQYELESMKSALKGEQQNDLKLTSICRNSGGEGPSRVGKRKISWQDPVALRV